MDYSNGTTVYVGTEARYYGRGIVAAGLDYDKRIGQQTYAVKLADGRVARVAADQMHATARDAKAHATQTIWRA